MKYRVHKTKDYTTICNYHLRDKNLSLKAKGLLSLMLSLPDDWNYTVNGLVSITKENNAAIESTLAELKEYGYLIITKKLPNETKSGRFEYEYDIYEMPQVEKQGVEKQGVEIQGVEIQGVENHPLYKYTDNKILNNKILNNKVLNTHSIRGEQNFNIDEIIDYFNSLDLPLPKAKFTYLLLQQINELFKRGYAEPDIFAVFERVGESEYFKQPFSNGTKPTILWVTKLDNFEKILSGSFDYEKPAKEAEQKKPVYKRSQELIDWIASDHIAQIVDKNHPKLFDDAMKDGDMKVENLVYLIEYQMYSEEEKKQQQGVNNNG